MTDSSSISNPFARFDEIYRRALASDIREPTAMALATATPDGRPSVRMVLLKGWDPDGFVFYTNLESRKAVELEANPRAAICFHWQPLEIQVRVEGEVRRVSEEEADGYFNSRPRGSRIGAWASLQSRPLPVRSELETRVQEIDARYSDVEIPRPAFWSGYRISPDRIEFWSGKPDRLHERDLYVKDPATGSWSHQLLYP